jgi:hypothetical protein
VHVFEHLRLRLCDLGKEKNFRMQIFPLDQSVNHYDLA